MQNLILTCLIVVLIYKTLVFFLSLLLERNDIADVSWGISFILIVITTLIFTNNLTSQLVVVSTFIFIWGTRLATRIALRNRGKKEDFRYLKLRQESGKYFLLRSFLQVYLLQGILALIVAFPVYIIATSKPNDFNNLIFIGISVWLVGFFFEAIGDYQLDKFITNTLNKGKLLTTGLWKYTRHPNYFGEITMWWGIFLVALTMENGIWAIIGPLAITFLIVKVSGIPMLEKKYIGNTEYEKYKQKTSILIPLPSKPST